jgi:hypothetical protein
MRGATAGMVTLLAVAACGGAPIAAQRWDPPVPGPLPDVVAQRLPLPFCGVATNARDPVLRCLVEALRARQPAEVGIIAGQDAGDEVGVVRLLPDMTVELLFYGDDHWRRGTCRTLVEEEPPAIINVTDCTDPVDLTAPPPDARPPVPVPVPTMPAVPSA